MAALSKAPEQQPTPDLFPSPGTSTAQSLLGGWERGNSHLDLQCGWDPKVGPGAVVNPLGCTLYWGI